MFYPNLEYANQLHQARLADGLRASLSKERLRGIPEATCDSNRMKYLVLKLSDLRFVKQMLAFTRPTAPQASFTIETAALTSA
jgi:hypothetical protein